MFRLVKVGSREAGERRAWHFPRKILSPRDLKSAASINNVWSEGRECCFKAPECRVCPFNVVVVVGHS